MEDKLRLLTQKIYEEGVEKARAEAASIVEDAQRKAENMVAEAERQAHSILEKAQREADELKENTASEIRLSSRQAVSALKQEIARIVTFRSSEAPLKEAMNDKAFLSKIIEIAVMNWGQNGQEQADLALVLPEKTRSEVGDYLRTEIKAQLDKGLELRFSNKLDNGFRIGPADGSYVVSFSEKDFDNLFREYLRPKTAHLLFGE